MLECRFELGLGQQLGYGLGLGFGVMLAYLSRERHVELAPTHRARDHIEESAF